MTRERIEDMREVVLPFVKKRLLETNYEGLGEADAKEFERDFNEILNLAIKGLEQEPTTKNDSSSLEKNSKKLEKDFGELVEIDLYSVIKQKYIERDVLDKIDEIITDALDKSTDQKESQTLRWVLDKISEVM